MCKVLCLVGVIGMFTACVSEKKENTLFTLLSPSDTGIRFENQLSESDTFNILNYLYYYNGGGVAAGDINNDGLVDLYFTANELSNKLYLNLGDFRFEDVTELAGVAGLPGWTTGVTMADVNGDGWLDIYVSQLGEHEGVTGYNQLYINQADTSRGHPVFIEQAEVYGLAKQSFATQAYFFDYDLDNDLDVYLLNHTVHSPDTYVPVAKGRKSSEFGDKLLQNKNGVFEDVSEESGIYQSVVGYGLSASVADINLDGFPDIYVANDFHENDYLYINNGNGTFTEHLEEMIGHTSRFSMGSDIADFNNDSYPDIVSLDMKPEDERVLKISAGEDPYDIFQYKLNYGYNYQYARNNLQLNTPAIQPVADSSKITYAFREIGQYAGISATDWSWSALWADLDNDGWKDLYVTNGILRRPNNLDYIKYISNAEIQAGLQGEISGENRGLIDKMPSEAIANYAYKNQQNLTFANKAEDWGLAQPGFSNGAAYADLDNDGDLDLIVNNVNAFASLYRNNSSTQSDHHFLQVQLEGVGQNQFGVGAKVWLYENGNVQYQELMPARGFQSSVAPQLHFGLDKAEAIDSLVVRWPGGRKQSLVDVAGDQVLVLNQEDAQLAPGYPSKPDPWFEVQNETGIKFTHRENEFSDITQEPLMPHLLSREGPALATGDVNGDGLDDVFLGGATNQMSVLLLQKPDGSFLPSNQPLWRNSIISEDVAAEFIDVDGDSDLDLCVGSAGNQYTNNSLQDRLYINDGAGQFSWMEDALPPLLNNTSCIAPHDFDADGDIDLFIGSRVVTGRYGINPVSHLLENDGSGHFRDVTEEYAPQLRTAGMVTDAAWTDYDQDGKEDLIVVGEWMLVSVFRNEDSRLTHIDLDGLANSVGWWNCIEAVDIDNDGDEDWIAGNLGLNSVIQADSSQPARLYVHDFDQNGNTEQILSFYKNGQESPFATKDELTQQIPSLRKKYAGYAEFADQTVEDIFGKKLVEEAMVKKAFRFASAIIINQGAGNFEVVDLPPQAQLSPIRSILPIDVNQDGATDLLLGGNSYAIGPKQGRYDASFGWYLINNGQGSFQVMNALESGLFITGQISSIALVNNRSEKTLVIIGRNNQEVMTLQRSQNKSVLP